MAAVINPMVGVSPCNETGDWQLGPLSLVTPQGIILAVTGDRPGKKTMLLLVARFISPVEGAVRYPANLRVRYIHAEPMILSGSVIDNLRFGNQSKVAWTSRTSDLNSDPSLHRTKP